MTNCMYQINHILQNFQLIEVDKIIKKTYASLDDLDKVYKTILQPKLLLEKLNADKNHFTLKKSTIQTFKGIVKNDDDAERFMRKIIVELDNLYKCFKLSFNEICVNDKCYVCGENVSKFCRVCNKYFCAECIGDYHSPYERQEHFRNSDDKKINFNNINFIDYIQNNYFREFFKAIVRNNKEPAAKLKEDSENKYIKLQTDLATQVKIKCTECDSSNKLTANFCISCGKSLKTDPKLEDVKQDRDERKPYSNKGIKECPICTFQNDVSKNFCEMCTHKFF